jgi:hypothetical protein
MMMMMFVFDWENDNKHMILMSNKILMISYGADDDESDKEVVLVNTFEVVEGMMISHLDWNSTGQSWVYSVQLTLFLHLHCSISKCIKLTLQCVA